MPRASGLCDLHHPESASPEGRPSTFHKSIPPSCPVSSVSVKVGAVLSVNEAFCSCGFGSDAGTTDDLRRAGSGKRRSKRKECDTGQVYALRTGKNGRVRKIGGGGRLPVGRFWELPQLSSE